MSIKEQNDKKFCLTCEKHFYAEEESHEDAYHSDGMWMYIVGNYKDAIDKGIYEL